MEQGSIRDSDNYHHQIYLPVPKKPFFPLPFSGLARAGFSLPSFAGFAGFAAAFGGTNLGGGDLGVLASFRAVWNGLSAMSGRAVLAVTCLAGGAGVILGTLVPRLGLFGQHWYGS